MVVWKKGGTESNQIRKLPNPAQKLMKRDHISPRHSALSVREGQARRETGSSHNNAVDGPPERQPKYEPEIQFLESGKDSNEKDIWDPKATQSSPKNNEKRSYQPETSGP